MIDHAFASQSLTIVQKYASTHILTLSPSKGELV